MKKTLLASIVGFFVVLAVTWTVAVQAFEERPKTCIGLLCERLPQDGGGTGTSNIFVPPLEGLR